MYKRRFFRRPRRKIVRRRRATVSKATKSYVKKILHKAVENKIVVDYANNQTWSSSTSTTNSFRLIPVISQGSTDSTLIGNNCRCVSGQVKLQLFLTPYNATTNPLSAPVMVRVMVIKHLVNLTQAGNLPDLSSLFKISSGTAGPQYTLLDCGLPINNVKFRCLYNKVFELGATYGSSTGPLGSNSYFDNSKMIKHITINYGKWIRKQLEFQDGTTSCANDNLYVVMLAHYANGTSQAINPMNYSFQNTFRFEDC